MFMITNVVMFCCFLSFCGAIYYGIRIEQVYKYRSMLISTISEAGRRDIERGDWRNLIKRWNLYDSVSYHRMMREFWKPVDSFYDWNEFHFED